MLLHQSIHPLLLRASLLTPYRFRKRGLSEGWARIHPVSNKVKRHPSTPVPRYLVSYLMERCVSAIKFNWLRVRKYSQTILSFHFSNFHPYFSQSCFQYYAYIFLCRLFVFIKGHSPIQSSICFFTHG
jgi:hypothetical protein